MGWISAPDGNVSSNDGSMTYASGLFTSGAPYSTQLTDPLAAPGAGKYFTIDLPAGTYTGNVRLTVVTNTTSSVYEHSLFLEYDYSPIAVGVYTYDIGTTLDTDTIYCPAGVNDGGGGGGGATFTLEFETSEPVSTEFWQDLIGCEELA